MSGFTLPAPAQVKELLGSLFDGMNAKTRDKIDIAPKSTSYIAVYISDQGSPIGLCACDFDFAARAGAALSMLPPTAAQQAIKSRQLDGSMMDNLSEVMNICARLLLREGTPHMRLEKVYEAKQLPAGPAAIVAKNAGRADFELELGKYGKGSLAVLVA